MFPPSQGINLDIEAISGICGSVSIACWVVVFSPQIIENFRRGSADGLSLQFIIVWLLGDVFNILGAVLQGVLPTMIILAVYYTIADIVLLGQCFYYRGFTWKDEVHPPAPLPPPPSSPTLHSKHACDAAAAAAAADRRPPTTIATDNNDERRPLLPPTSSFSSSSSSSSLLLDRPGGDDGRANGLDGGPGDRRPSAWSSVDGTHLSPAVPLRDSDARSTTPPRPRRRQQRQQRRGGPPSWLKAVLFNTIVVLMVVLAGVLGWWLSRPRRRHHHYHHRGHRHGEQTWRHPSSSSGGGGGGEGGGSPWLRTEEGDGAGLDLLLLLPMNPLGQVFGYLCAALYLGSRAPQILLNHRRKSTEGVSMLFFLFACIGNLTYVLSIFAYEPRCHGSGSGSGEDTDNLDAVAATTTPTTTTTTTATATMIATMMARALAMAAGSHAGRGCARGEALRVFARYILVNASWIAGSLGTLLLDMAIFVQFFVYRSGGEGGGDHGGWGGDDAGDADGRAAREEGHQDEGYADQRPLLSRGD